MSRFLYLIILLGLVGCKPSSKPTNGQVTPVIMVSIEPLRFLAESIVGDSYKVVSLVPSGSSPETYEPTSTQMIDFERSDMFFYFGGLGFERTWLEKLKQLAPNVLFVGIANDIKHLGSHSHDTSEGTECHHDPHIWTSPNNMRDIARSIHTTLCAVDSARSDFYTSNLASLLLRIDAVNDSICSLTNGLSSKGFLIYHPTLTYFAHDYGLNQIAIESDGKEPSPYQLVNIIKKCRQDSVKLIFVQQEFTQRSCQVVAEEIGAKIVTINPLSYDWEREMLKIAHALKEQ